MTLLSTLANSTFQGYTGSKGYTGSIGYTGSQGQTGPISFKTISVEEPQADENIPVFHTKDALSVTKLVSYVSGNNAQVTFSIVFTTPPSSNTTEIVVGGTIINSNDGIKQINSFNNSTIPANSFVSIITTDSNLLANWLNVTLEF